MKNKKHIVFVTSIAVGILAFCAWVFGWFGGKINLMEFSADDVESMELSCSHILSEAAVVTGKEDIQTIIDTVNDFRYSGNDIKQLLRYGFSAGGSVLFEISVHFSNGGQSIFCFCPEAHSNYTELAYWVYQPNHIDWISKYCKGNLDWFFAIREKYAGPMPEDNPFTLQQH